MKVLQGPWEAWSADEPHALAIGVFDGVHLGHRAVLDSFAGTAQERGLRRGVVTFDRHPLALLAPEQAPKMLSTLERRLELLAELGIDVAAVLRFDDDMRSMDPAAFVTEILSRRLRAALVVVGEDFRFGRGRGGDPQLLRAIGPELGFEVSVLDLVGEGSPISSTRIRQHLASGDVEAASRLLGRPYQLQGQVVAGAGRSLATGAPTANLDVPTSLALPARGVYAGFAGSEPVHPAVANVGVRPTFGGTTEVVEVHLLDRDVDLSGQELRIDLIGRIRAEGTFLDADALADQIAEDIAVARRLLASHTP